MDDMLWHALKMAQLHSFNWTKNWERLSRMMRWQVSFFQMFAGGVVDLTDTEGHSQIQLLSKYGYKRKAVTLPEAPVQLELEEENAISQKAASSSRIVQLMGGDHPETAMADMKETEKISSRSEDTSTVSKSPQASEEPTVKSSPPVTIQKPIPAIADNSAQDVAEASPPISIDVAKEQKVTIGKDGKKRIRPVFVTSGNTLHNSLNNNKPQVIHNIVQTIDTSTSHTFVSHIRNLFSA
jgi:hypothetical protein